MQEKWIQDGKLTKNQRTKLSDWTLPLPQINESAKVYDSQSSASKGVAVQNYQIQNPSAVGLGNVNIRHINKKLNRT